METADTLLARILLATENMRALAPLQPLLLLCLRLQQVFLGCCGKGGLQTIFGKPITTSLDLKNKNNKKSIRKGDLGREQHTYRVLLF